MWWLQKVYAPDLVYLVTEKQSYVVGRKVGDIVLPGDSSISRQHCVIKVAKKESCPFPIRTLTGVWIVDEGSKYGTYVKENDNWTKLTPHQEKPLPHGSIIRFGVVENTNIWRLEYKPIIATSSLILGTQKQEVKRMLAPVDGELTANWSKQCTLLLVNQLTLTFKVVMALINGIPIVTTNYLIQVNDAVKNRKPMPNYKDFKPEIAESTLVAHQVSLNTEDHRKELLKGKQFAVPTEEQHSMLKDVVTGAGGSIEIINWGVGVEKYFGEGWVVIQWPVGKKIEGKSRLEDFKILAGRLRDRELRAVPDSEVAQAVAYNSVERFCNPRSSFLPRVGDEVPLEGNVVLPASEVQPQDSSTAGQVINSSLTQVDISQDKLQASPSKKRAHSPEPLASFKKPATSRTDIPLTDSVVSKDVFASDRGTPGSSVSQPFAPSKDLFLDPEPVPFRQEKPKLKQSKMPDSFWSLTDSVKPKVTKRKLPETDDLFGEKRRKQPESNELFSPTEKRLKHSEKDELFAQAEEGRNLPKTADPFREMQKGAGRKAALEGKGEEEKRKEYEWDADDFEGFIDPEEKINGEKAVKRNEGDPLSTTIIMLSLVTLAYSRRSDTTKNTTPVHNVKTFRKQLVHSSNRVIPVTSVSDDSDDDNWTNTSTTNNDKGAGSECF